MVIVFHNIHRLSRPEIDETTMRPYSHVAFGKGEDWRVEKRGKQYHAFTKNQVHHRYAGTLKELSQDLERD